ncbi:MAG: hypothetical protein ABSH09_01985 [Bryobacteraceae bacterium]
MSNVRFSKMLLAGAALTLSPGIVYATTPVSPLTAAPTSVSLSYQKPSTPGSGVGVKVTATTSTYFTVDPTTVPIWLSLDTWNGDAVSGGLTVTFSPSAIAASLGAGTFGTTVHLQVTGYADALVPVTLVVKDVASTLTVSQGDTQAITWTQGSAYPTATLTLLSSEQPIACTIAVTNLNPSTPANWIVVNHSSAVAYNFGTPIAVTFLQQALDNATVGTNLTGTVAITPAGGSEVDVAFTITVAPPSPAYTHIYPTQTPVASSGNVTVVLTGTGFVGSGSDATVVDVTSGTTTTALTSGVTVTSPTTIVVTLPAATYMASAGTLTIGAYNPPATADQTTINLTVTTDPIIDSITDTASYIQAPIGTAPTVAPYELISIFGANFGPASPILGATDSFGRYSNAVDDGTGTSSNVVVAFYKADGVTLIENAYLLYVSSTQINAIVPSGVVGNATVKIVISDGTNLGTAFTATEAAANPGIFTTSASGQGQGAILLSTYAVNSSTNMAVKGNTVLIYVSGLGAPTSTAANTASTTAAAYPAACISTANYMATVNGLTVKPSPLWTTIDGAVIASANIAAGHYAPCFATAPTVTIGGKAATVSYAGFVADSIGGLYQINAVVPTTVTSGSAVPVVVSVGTATSQSGVTMVVQ